MLAFRERKAPSINMLGVKKVDPHNVIVREIPTKAIDKGKNRSNWLSSLEAKNLIILGEAHYVRDDRFAVTEIRQLAASKGARIVYISIHYGGDFEKIVNVPVAFTPGKIATSTSFSSGTINANSYSSGSIGSTPYYGSSHGMGTYSGSTSTTTYIPGTTIYEPRSAKYPVYRVSAFFLAPKSALSESGLMKLKQYSAASNN